MVAKLPEGSYTIAGPAQENGENLGRTEGVVLFTHVIPAGPVLLAPAEAATVPTTGLVARWSPVTKDLDGNDLTIIAYQLIIEKDAPPHPHMIGKMVSLSMYVSPSVTSVAVPDALRRPARPTTGRCSPSGRAGTRRSPRAPSRPSDSPKKTAGRPCWPAPPSALLES
jgi:hypothetical protein